MNSTENPHYPDEISFGSNIKFDILWLQTQTGTYRDTSGNIKPSYAYKGCIDKAHIAGFELVDATLVAFVSLVESFLKNQLSTSKETKVIDITAKVITTNGEALLQIAYNDVKKTLNKATCNFILKSYQTATREFNLYFANQYAKSASRIIAAEIAVKTRSQPKSCTALRAPAFNASQPLDIVITPTKKYVRINVITKVIAIQYIIAVAVLLVDF